MCGIAGIVRIARSTGGGSGSDAIPESWLAALDAGITYRGPDSSGRFRAKSTNIRGESIDLAFVHRRLSIIDIASGQQPMVAPDGSAIVFNGCIYNHRQLRQDLKERGRIFASNHSDTEPLLHGWLEWGEDLFANVDGMYAAAWWNSKVSSCCIARDLFGEKPMYWTQIEHGGTTVRAFASTVPALLGLRRTLSASTDLDPAALAHWIRFGWGESLPYRDIHELPPGTLLDLTSSTCTPRHTANHISNFLEDKPSQSLTPENLDQLLRRAVHSRLESDVPMGFFLSGGIDSALVCKYAVEARPDLTAFTVKMPQDSFDESSVAKQTASFLRISHMVLPCHANPADDLHTLIRQLGLPFGDSSLLPATWVSRAVREIATVALGGDGGDELFMGYDRHRAISLLSKLNRLPSPVLAAAGAVVSANSDPKSFRTRLSRLLDAGAGSYKDLLAIFSRKLCHELGISSAASHAPHADPYRHARLTDITQYLPLDLLRKSDTASMSIALELRAPFLSREVAYTALNTAPETLMPGGERKGLLKNVARRYLPDSIVDRPKQGFAIPIGDWFRTDYGGMKTLLLDALHSADPFPGQSISRPVINRLIDEHMHNRRDHSQRLYMLLVLSLWLRS